MKKYFISNSPRGVWMNLWAVARDTVELVDADRLADHLEVERLEAGHPLEEERILPPNDLARHVEDGARALLQALGQPIGRLELSGDILPVLLALRAAPDLGDIDLVDENARQRVAVELDAPAEIRRGGDVHVGNRGRCGRIAEGAAWLRFEAP